MLWVPALSIVIFLMLFIPSVIFGFWKGWKASVVIASSFIVTTFIWIGFGYALYNSFIWPLYKNFILNRVVDSSINVNNLDSLKDLYRLRAILIWSGILTPFTYLITWIISKVFKTKLARHLGPKTQKISNSERKILVKKNPLTSKLIGGGVIAVSSLFVSSFAASAVNSIFTPRKNANGFNKFTNSLEKIYTFGLAQNNNAPWYVDEFFSNADGETMDSIDNLTNFENINNKEFQKPKMKSINYIKNKRKLFDLIYTSKEATEAVLNVAFKNSNRKINPLLMDSNFINHSSDSIGNQIGYKNPNQGFGEAFSSRTKFIADYKAWLKASPVDLNLPGFVKDIYTKGLENKMINFEDTPFFVNYEKARKLLDKTKTSLDHLKNKKKKTIEDRQKQIQKRDQLDNELRNIVSPNWTSPGFTRVKTNYDLEGTEADYEEYSISPAITRSIDKSKISAGSQLHAEYSKETNLTGIRDAKKSLKDTADTDVTNKENLFMNLNGQNYSENNAKTKMDDLIYKAQVAKNNLSNATSTLRDRIDYLEDAQETRDTMSKKIADINKEINSIQRLISDQQVKINDIKIRVDDANAEMNNAKQDLDSAKSDLDMANRNTEFCLANQQTAQTNLNNSIKDQKNKEIEKDKAWKIWQESSNANKAKNKQDYDIKNRAFDNAVQDTKLKQKELDQRKQDYLYAKHNERQVKEERDQKQKNYDDKEKIYINLSNSQIQIKDVLRMKNNQLITEKNDLNNFTRESQIAKDRINELNDNSSNSNSIAWASVQKQTAITTYNSALNKQIDFQNPFSKNSNIMKGLRWKQTQANNAYYQAQQDLENQKSKIDKLIVKAVNDFEEINECNKQIKDLSESILVYIHRNPNLNNKTTQKTFYRTTGQYIGNIIIADDGSIYYLEQKILADADKLHNLEVIKNNSEKRFNDLKKEMIEEYREWIGS